MAATEVRSGRGLRAAPSPGREEARAPGGARRSVAGERESTWRGGWEREGEKSVGAHVRDTGKNRVFIGEKHPCLAFR